MRCMETVYPFPACPIWQAFNKNMRCMETVYPFPACPIWQAFNKNMRCMETNKGKDLGAQVMGLIRT